MHPRVLGTWPVTFSIILLTAGIPFNAACPAGDGETWNPRQQGRFIVSLCADNDGGIWVGTEGNGLWRKAPDEDNWTHVTRASTGGFAEELGPVLTTGTSAETCLGDDTIYALACDRRGRIWAGHLNHGVSVFNGTAWRNYDVLSGPLGERVFDIAVCPVDGDVWIASDAGLARYREKQDTWSYYTRADGLPEDQANSLAFDKSGRLFVGTQCHGIAVAPARKEARGRLAYPRWRVVSAPERFGPGKRWQLPLSPAGNGLPTNMINQVLVGRDGTVWAATVAGLAFSRDGGRSWRHVRGKNFVAKVEKSWAGTPPGWKRPPKRIMQRLLPEDYITCLAEYGDKLLLGTWRKGLAVYDPAAGRCVAVEKGAVTLDDDYVSAAETGPAGRPWIGSYGGGLARARKVLVPGTGEDTGALSAKKSKRAPAEPDSGAAKLPAPAAPPTAEDIDAMIREVRRYTKPLPQTCAAVIGDDWTTWGDWVGRYGRQAGINLGVNAPADMVNGYVGIGGFDIKGYLGPHHRKGDRLRVWCAEPECPGNDKRRRLWVPKIGIRRQASWDDHGEAYPREYEGPNIWLKFTVPDGIYRVCIYFFNNDGHRGNNRHRDYLVRVYQNPRVSKIHIPETKGDFDLKRHLIEEKSVRKRDLENCNAAYFREPLCKTRVRQFHGGVYKQFIMKGPYSYFVNVRKNASFNIKFSGLFITRIIGDKPRTERHFPALAAGINYQNDAYERLKNQYTIHEENIIRTVMQVNNAARTALARRGGVELWEKVRLLAYRTALDEKATVELLYDLRWPLRLWTWGDRQEYRDLMTFTWYWYQKKYDFDRLKKARQYSPHVYETAEEWEEHEEEFKPINRFRIGFDNR